MKLTKWEIICATAFISTFFISLSNQGAERASVILLMAIPFAIFFGIKRWINRANSKDSKS